MKLLNIRIRLEAIKLYAAVGQETPAKRVKVNDRPTRKRTTTPSILRHTLENTFVPNVLVFEPPRKTSFLVVSVLS